MTAILTSIGFGEAASAFAPGWQRHGYVVRVYDRRTDDATMRGAKHADYQAAGVSGMDSVAEALSGSDIVLCLVTADQATAAAREAAMTIAPGTFWIDMNSVGPETKRAAARVIEGVGGRYVDVAVLSPVHPKGLSAPLLVSGPHADDAAQRLRAIGFSNVSRIDGPVGAAAAVKMIRSVMVKGIEALSAECALAAERAGVTQAVVDSLDASWPGADWGPRIDYNLDRMMVHGLRRAAEMEEAVSTLEALGVGTTMTRSIVTLQRSIGAMGIAPPDGLDAKLQALTASTDEVAA